ncbi:type I restriction endonuclease subunit R [Shimazuella kribbensis]|uniref:type I restriction endonuclease subunit R n=1 Tax=Shimazuella kribbensis TaxID=139808 RepID=UPI0003FD30DA|nr:type I restriction endonuclease subunit R [Shimazuella kribbensis]
MSTGAYLEQDLEQAVLEYFQELGYDVVHGPDLSPGGDYPERDAYSEVILQERLRDAMFRINPHLPMEAVEEAVRRVMLSDKVGLLANNQAFHELLTTGIPVSVRLPDGSFKTEMAFAIDFQRMEHNDWLVVDQFTVIENRAEKRPDVVVFVNGIPLVVIELKNIGNEETDITQAFQQIKTYQNKIPTLFQTNAFSVISDGVNARVGTLTADEDRYMMWRTMDGEEVAAQDIPQIEVLLKGIFRKEIFLDVIKHFLLFQSDGSNTWKIFAGYHQYHATRKALASTLRATDEGGDKKIGVVWHTQGSGKSLSMVFYAGKVVQELNNPTILVLTDRNDLDEQLFQTFSSSHQLLRQTPVQAKSRAHLRELLQVEAGGIVFSTIQKFLLDKEEEQMPILTNRRNVVVIADEAHRSQYGIEAKVKKTGEITYGFAKYMNDALPNASFIGFTGTPVELTDRNTPAVFGDYIDVYDMTRAVEDGTTVKIFYESRLAKLEMSKEMRSKIDREVENISSEQEFDTQEKMKSKWSQLEALVGAEDRLQSVAKDLVKHFEDRRQSIFGKGMIVTMSRRIAADLYDAIIALRADWHSDSLAEGKIKVVYTNGNSSDPLSMQKHHTTKQQREKLAARMRDPEDELQLVIVVDMWLTGFDVPCMHSIYIDKPMKGHNLMQAIARVNRVFQDKPGGLVVDYIGISDSLKHALKQYADRDRQNTGVDTRQAFEVMLEKYDLLTHLLHGHDYTLFFEGTARQRLQQITITMDYVLGLGEEKKKKFIQLAYEVGAAFTLCGTLDEAKTYNEEISFFKTVRASLMKMIADPKTKKTSGQMDAQMRQLVSKSIISDDVVDVFDAAGLSKPNIGLLSEDFMEEVKALEQKNLAVELLKRLLKSEVRSFGKRNLVKSKKFSEMLDQAILKYQNRSVDTSIVVQELVNIAKDINKAKKEGKPTDLNSDEEAFYDALSDNESAKEILGEVVLKQIARDLTKMIRNNLTVDWNLRESVRARLRVEVKRLLKKYGYPPDQQKMATDMVLQQTELTCQSDFDEEDE